MYGLAFLVLLPLFGWWLIRTTRSFDRLAAVVNENNTDLGFLSFRQKVMPEYLGRMIESMLL